VPVRYVANYQLSTRYLCDLKRALAEILAQIVLPQNYLKEAYRLVREAGGVCIADEVQVCSIYCIIPSSDTICKLMDGDRWASVGSARTSGDSKHKMWFQTS